MRSFKLLMSVSIFLIIGLSSCLKDHHDDYWYNGPVGFVNVANLSAQSGRLSFAFDPNRVYTPNFEYKRYSTYNNVYAGNRKFLVFPAGSLNSIVEKNIEVKDDHYYSIFIVDTADKMDAVFLNDSTDTPGQDSIHVRFANMSPDVNKIDFYVEGQDEPLATGVTYKTATDFMAMKVVNNVKFIIKKSGSNQVLATSETYNDIQPRRIYSIVSSGYSGITSGDYGPIRIGKMIH